MVFVDPPYNVAIAGHVSGLGKVRHREFEMASGEMSSAQYTKFLANAFSRLAEFSANGSFAECLFNLCACDNVDSTYRMPICANY